MTDERLIITGIICITTIILYALSILKSRIETKRLQAKCDADRAELELRRENRLVRPPHGGSYIS